MKQFDVAAAATPTPSENTTNLLLERVRLTPNKVLFGIPEGDAWRDITATQFLEQVRALAKGFVAAGINPGDRIGIMSHTRYEWVLIDFAMWFAGGVLVPVYETNGAHQIQWDLTDSESVAFIGENDEIMARFAEVSETIPLIRHSWQIDSGDLDRLVEAGRDISDDEIERRRRIATGNDIATLIYTSGSTGNPKGVVLTHANFVELSRNTVAAMPEVLGEDASTVLFITIAHVFARFISVVTIYAGVRVGHQADTRLLMPALSSFKPTFLLMVPRVFEKVYNTAEQQAEAGGHGRIFRAAAATAVAYSKARAAGRIPFGLKIKQRIYDRLVLSRLREAIGGRVRVAISGSAPLSTHLGHFFSTLGIDVLEGYGLTETTAPATVNRSGKTKIGTVGTPLPGNSVRIADDGEIEIRGCCVFAGYWKNDELNRQSFDGEWFATGDLGELDNEGYLTITGRKKDIIVTAGGKNVAPTVLEDPIRSNTLVDQVVVVGEGRPFISALVTLDTEMLPAWLKNNGLDPDISLAEAANNPAVIAEVQKAVDTANRLVSRAESIRSFEILPVQFTEASGHLTPKLSIKRAAIYKDFAAEIDAIYQHTSTQGLSLKA